MLELKLEKVSKTYGSKKAVDGIDCVLSQGVYGLLGANGAGKTTLLRMICGILEMTEGRILCEGTEIRKMGRNIADCWDICRRISVIIRSFRRRSFCFIWRR